jgi:hypothetical protein
VEDQGQIGSCTANAIVGAIEFGRRRTGDQVDLSRLFLYYNARRMRGAEHEDGGATITHGMGALLTHGVPPETAWPYDPAKVAEPPDAAAYERAAGAADIEYARVDGLEHVKGALAQEQPVVFSISLPEWCYGEAGRRGVIPVPTDEELALVLTQHGRHAMLLVGYDSDGNFFHVRNSWGTGWGDQGYCRLSFDTFQRATAADSTWVLGSLEASGAFSVVRPALTPRAVNGGVKDSAASIRDDVRAGLGRDLAEALKGVRQRVNPNGR